MSSYQKNCGNAYCMMCGECLSAEDRKLYEDGYCIECHTKLPEGALTCPKCGNYVKKFFFDD